MLRLVLAPVGVIAIFALPGCGARTTLRVPGEGGDADATQPDAPNDRGEDPLADPPVDPRPDPPADPMGDPPPPPPPWSGITNVSVSASTVDGEPSIAVNNRGEAVV